MTRIMSAATMVRLAAAANGGVAYALPVAALLKCIVSSSCRKITTSAQAQETITIRTLSSSIKDFYSTAGNEMPDSQLFTISMPSGRVGDDQQTAMWPPLYIIIGVRVNEVKIAGVM